MSQASINGTEPIYITTSIPYVNARPHIGHALEFVQADVLARYHRLCGREVRFQTGTDENASKNVQAARAAGVDTRELVAQNADRFQLLANQLHVAHDKFIRTASDGGHRRSVTQIWEAARANGDIYKKRYCGLYCTGCELFYGEAELEDGCCPVHNTAPDYVEEENYFFRLSRYAEQLIHLIESDELQIVPTTRKNEVVSFVRQGLQDFSISRPVERTGGWGIPVPGSPNQIIYVWFDALINYVSGLGYADAAGDYARYWREENSVIHVIGKDIIRFHAIYWPAILLSAGLPLPRKILVHGFISVNGQKISKSAGNVIDPVPLLNNFGAEALRYYLIRHVPTTSDANYTDATFRQVYRADLADQLGNLVQRTVRLIELYGEGGVPEPGAFTPWEEMLIDLAQELPDRLREEFSRDRLHHAVVEIWNLIAAVNKYIVEIRPWDLVKTADHDETSRDRLQTCLYTLVETLRIIAHALLPFLPDTAVQIGQRLGFVLNQESWPRAFTWGQTHVGAAVKNGAPLFPKRL